ncbi:MAG: VTT domain-containing protein [Desulfarculaceae bacterium]|nr:VTT domain-containing protein [Desulfarculaceae bacterium]MCF8048661.1 VTT domain-containing protein [Desulfarculaceae bacterium]
MDKETSHRDSSSPPPQESAKGSGRPKGGPVLQPGRTIWRKARAERLAVLVDGEEFFDAFVQAAQQARHSLYILSWDIDSKLHLNRGCDEPPLYLGEFLSQLSEERPGLRVHILNWDFSMIYALEREFLPIFRLGWRTDGGVRFAMDDKHPLGASHHQKVVVVDDDLALLGGFDLARNRWDTHEHSPEDSRRVNSKGQNYGPFHDVQALVQGPVAACLGELFRWRWQRSQGEELAAPPETESDPWPEEIEPAFQDIEVALARTLPAYDSEPEVREIQRMHLEAIASAQHYIFLENQYLTSWKIGRALTERLREPESPEVVMILPRRAVGWLEESTMHALRLRLLGRLREADKYGRLKVYYPHVPGLGKEEFVNVHSKVLIVDDHFLKIGSANASNRSMGLDTECDLALEANGDPRTVRGIAACRNRLLGEHLGVPHGEVEATVQERGSLCAAVESLRGPGRSLRELDEKPPEWLDPELLDNNLLDPEKPIEARSLVKMLLPHETRLASKGKLAGLLILLLVLGGLAVAWRWGPLSEMLDASALASWAYQFSHGPIGVLLVLGAFLLGGAVMLPVTLLMLATGLVYDPWLSPLYALSGCLLSAVAFYWIGRLLGRGAVERLAGDGLNDLSRRLAEHGIINVAIMRNLPVAPFTVVNLVAGASHISFRDFALGTALGLLPGVVLFTTFSGRVKSAIQDPGPWQIAAVVAAAAGLFLLAAWSKRHLMAEEKAES